MWSFINDQWVIADEAVVSVADLSVQRGYGVFDFFRTVNAVPLFIDDHLERLEHSAAALRLPIRYNRDQLKQIIRELIQKNDCPDSGIRITITGGVSSDGYSPASPNLIITQQPLLMNNNPAEVRSIRLVTYEHTRELPHVKSINYLMGVYLQEQVKQAGADDVLYTHSGSVSELPRSNIFIISKDGHLVTPAEKILHGITRKHLLELAEQQMTVQIRPVSVDELLQADEVFISSTTKRLWAVTAINQQKIGKGTVGAITQQLYKSFIDKETAFLRSGW